MTWFPESQEEIDFFSELRTMPDRTVGLLAGTIIDDRLEKALRARWHDTKIESQQLFDRIFNYTGPVGSFGTRIDIGFAVGIYNDETLRDLHTIRKIRNAFAHKIAPKDFTAQQLIDLTSNLKIPEKHPITVPYDKPYSLTAPPGSNAFQLVRVFLQHSSVPDISPGRNRYIRAAELLSGLLFATSVSPPRPLPDF
jgi:DNA-binding MltR family transcriptional regulator